MSSVSSPTAAADVLLTKHRSQLLWLFVLLNFAHMVDFILMMPLGDRLMKIFAITPQQFSIAVSIYTFSAGLSSFAATFFLDRFDRRPALLVAAGGFVLGTALCGSAYSYWVLLLARCITGIFGGVASSLVLAAISDLYEYHERGKAMGLYSISFSISSIVGVPFGLYLANLYDWHVPFLAVAAFGALIWILMLAWLPSLRKHLQQAVPYASPLTYLKQVLRDSNQVYALCLGFFITIGHFVLIPFFAPYMVRNIGFTQEQIPLIYLVGGSVSVVSSPLLGRLSDRYSSHQVLKVLIALAVIPTLLITHLTAATHLWFIFVVIALFFVLGGGRYIPAQTLMSGAVAAQQRGGFMSLRAAVQNIASGLSSTLAGFIIVQNADGTLGNFSVVGYLSILLTFFCLWFIPRIRVVE